jgi:hypothetical protein
MQANHRGRFDHVILLSLKWEAIHRKMRLDNAQKELDVAQKFLRPLAKGLKKQTRLFVTTWFVFDTLSCASM